MQKRFLPTPLIYTDKTDNTHNQWINWFYRFYRYAFSKSYRDKSVLLVQIRCVGYFSFLAITVHGVLKVVGRRSSGTAHYFLQVTMLT